LGDDIPLDIVVISNAPGEFFYPCFYMRLVIFTDAPELNSHLLILKKNKIQEPGKNQKANLKSNTGHYEAILAQKESPHNFMEASFITYLLILFRNLYEKTLTLNDTGDWSDRGWQLLYNTGVLQINSGRLPA
jgi:hypothetical protein